MGQIVLNIGLALVFAGIIIVWFVRFLQESGCFVKENRLVCFCKGRGEENGSSLRKEEIVRVFGIALAVRAVIYMASVIGGMFFFAGAESEFTIQNFLDLWEKWDAKHYIALAEQGYEDYVENGQHLFLVFFPLYPWIVRMVDVVIGNWQVTCLLVSTLTFCVGSVYFYGFIKEEFGKEVGKGSYALLICYPFAFFFGGMMTESLFFCLISAGLFYCKRHKWWLVGVIGLLAALCRVQGILLFGVGMVEFFVACRPFSMLREKEGKKLLRAFFTKAVWLFLVPIGNVIYFGINYAVEGDWFRFQYYQEKHWYHETTWMGNCIGEIIRYATGGETSNEIRASIWIPELIVFILALACIIYGLRIHSLKNTAFLIVYLVVNYSITFLISGGRYMLCALPMFVIMAQFGKRHKYVYGMMLLTGLLLQGIYFAGFLSGHQIM